MAEVVAAGISLLRRQEQERAAFVASLDDAIAEGECDGFFTIEEVEHGVDAAIAEVTNTPPVSRAAILAPCARVELLEAARWIAQDSESAALGLRRAVGEAARQRRQRA